MSSRTPSVAHRATRSALGFLFGVVAVFFALCAVLAAVGKPGAPAVVVLLEIVLAVGFGAVSVAAGRQRK